MRAIAAGSAGAPGAIAFLYGALLVGLIDASGGGYAPTTWGWTSVVTLWLAAVGIAVRGNLSLSRLEIAFFGALAAYTAWLAASLFWSASVPSTMRELQLAVSYVGVVAAGIVLVERRSTAQLLGGALTGTTLVGAYGLATRLFPGRFISFAQAQTFGYRLAKPITYWNGMGIFAALGVLLGFGLAARAQSRLGRGLAGATIPLLACTTYFTFSRGAFAALAVGLVVILLVDPRRLQLLSVLLVLAPWSAIALLLARDRPGLTTQGVAFKAAVHDGHTMVVPVLVLMLASGVAAAVFGYAECRLEVPRAIRIGFAAAAIAVLIGGAGVVWTEVGPPQHLASRAWSSFQAVPNPTGANLSNRLFQLSNNGRIGLWQTSWHAFKAKPLAGNGGGTFWELLAANPKATFSTSYGHSVYLQTLAELGVVGFVLLMIVLFLPLGAFFVRRREPVASVAAGAVAAWLAHMALDWDWELSGVSVVGLLCAVVLVGGRVTASNRSRPSFGLRAVLGTLLAVLAVASLAPVLSEEHVSAGRRALNSHLDVARAEAREAERWAPWSSDAWMLEGDTETRFSNLLAARSAYRRAISLDSQNWLAWRLLANASAGRGRVNALYRVRRLHPGNG